MVKPTRIWVWIVLALVLPVAGCGGGDDEDETPANAVDGTFVGKVSQTDAFVAVVVSPAARGQDRRDVMVYVSDGKRLSESFTGSATGSDFTAKSDGDTQTKGKLSDNAATGTIELPDDKTARFQANRATAAAGLYSLEVSPAGKLSGASAAGVGLTGRIPARKRGTGSIKLADGTRHRFAVSRNSAGELVGLETGEVRMIVLSDGELRGAGKGRAPAGGEFFVASSK
jgi:hypothetical protein